MTASAFREQFLHNQGVVLDAVGRVGNSLIDDPRPWTKKLDGLGSVGWRRDDPQWQGRAIVGGTVHKGRQNVLLTGALIKMKLKIPLGADERRAEEAMKRGKNATG